MSPPTINLIIIHTNTLGIRRQIMATAIATFKDIVSSTAFVMKPDPVDISKDIEKRIKYDPVSDGDADFTKAMQPLSLEQLSNLLKHEEAWRRAAAAPAGVMTLVMEDDAYILPESVANLAGLVPLLADADASTNYHVILLGVAATTVSGGEQRLHHVKDSFKIIPNKEAYLISSEGARILLAGVKTIRFGTRYYMSYMSATGALKVVHPSLRITADASKLGLLPSSIQTSNLLILNHEYMQLWNMLSTNGIDLAAATAYYKKLEHIQSGDIMHLYGVILYRCGKKTEGRDLLIAAIEQLQQKGGLVNARSDILNNTIQIFQAEQDDLGELNKKISRYTAN